MRRLVYPTTLKTKKLYMQNPGHAAVVYNLIYNLYLQKSSPFPLRLFILQYPGWK